MDLNFKKIGKGPAIVVLHGLFGMSDNWMSVAKKMSPEYSFYLLDLRNHGRSPHSSNMTYDLMTSDLKLFFEKHNLSEVVLLGHSMGGKVAMNFSVKYPYFLKKLIVVDTSLKKYPSSHFIDFLNAMLAVDLNVSSRKEIERDLLSVLKTDIVNIHFLLKNIYRNENNGFQWRIDLSALKENMDNILGSLEIDKPVKIKSLFMKGSESDYILPDDERIIKQNFPNAQIVEIEHATHLVHSSSPLKFENALRFFLNQ
jgi:esterase